MKGQIQPRAFAGEFNGVSLVVPVSGLGQALRWEEKDEVEDEEKKVEGWGERNGSVLASYEQLPTAILRHRFVL